MSGLDLAWRASVSKIDGYAGMSDRECEAWARRQADLMAVSVEHAAILRAMEMGVDYIAVERCDRVSVSMPREYRMRSGWTFDRDRPFQIEGHGPRWVHHFILDSHDDHPPRPPMVVVRKIASA